MSWQNMSMVYGALVHGTVHGAVHGAVVRHMSCVMRDRKS